MIGDWLTVIILVLAFWCSVAESKAVALFETVTVIEGRNLSVTCNVTVTPGFHVYWQSLDHAYYQAGVQLNIPAITRNSTGLYSCMEKNQTRLITVDTVFVDVLYQASIESIWVNNNTLCENETLHIRLSVAGNPLPETVFYFREEQLQNVTRTGNITFTVAHVTCEEAGIYTVTCTNHLDHCVDSRTVNVTVLCAPRLDNKYSHNFTVQPLLGQTTHLQIHSVGYPYPTYNWTYRGRPLTHHTDTGHTSNLTVTNVTVGDYGLYTLLMENDIGATSIQYTVEANGPPGKVSNVHVINITSINARVDWLSGFDYGRGQVFVVSWYNTADRGFSGMAQFNDTTPDDGGVRVAHVIQLRPGTNYTLTIRSVNDMGDSAMSEPVTFRTLVTEKNSTTLVIAVVSGSGAAIILVAAIVVVVRYKRRNRRRAHYENIDDQQATQPGPNPAPQPVREPPLQPSVDPALQPGSDPVLHHGSDPVQQYGRVPALQPVSDPELQPRSEPASPNRPGTGTVANCYGSNRLR